MCLRAIDKADPRRLFKLYMLNVSLTDISLYHQFVQIDNGGNRIANPNKIAFFDR
ncbi:Uncharacterised protein [Vibrio cholerae]|nr:Uncharacterised protein [Vibrio cholerae]CSI73499.1 Uncharacterised protein [Vibrio cholerae]